VMTRTTIGVLLNLVIGMTAIGPPALAGKERHDPTVQSIEQKRRDLEQLKHEIEEKRKQARETDKKKDSALQIIQDLDDRLALSRQERQQIGRQLKEKDREIEAITERLGAVRKEVAERRQSILSRLRVQYIEGRHGHLKALLASGSLADVQRRYQYLSALSKREYDLMQAYRRDLEELEGIERQRASAREALLGYKKHTEGKVAEIQGLRREKRTVLVRLNAEKETYEKALAELERSAARVDSLLRELEQRRRVAGARAKPDGVAGHMAKGALQWPADGDVISFFGRQKHPTFATYVQRKGIEIRTDEGSPIRAVMAGTVEYADWLKGYGQVLILDHGNGFFSLYAHASKLLAAVGERVEAGQVIGETGDTGLTGDTTLYFELREGAEAVDPLTWLAKRR
jgi:septal ring factor EnvC (AmiA/AmiB activator)